MDLGRREMIAIGATTFVLSGCVSMDEENDENENSLESRLEDRKASNHNIAANVTMYVREDGDDSQEGRRKSNAKETIKAAIEDAPLPSPKTAVEIDIGPGTFEGISLSLYTGTIPLIQLNGTTDENGNLLTTLSGSDGSHTVSVSQGSTLLLSNLEIEGGERGCLEVRNNSNMRLFSCYVHDGPNHSARVAWGGYLRDDENTIFDQSDVEGNGANIKVTAANADLKGIYIGDGGTNTIIRVKENGYAMLVDSIIIGEGNDLNDGSTHGIRCFHNSAIKMERCTIEDCYIGINREMSGWVKFQTDITFNNIGFEVNGSGGHHRDMIRGEEIYTLPRNDGIPENNWSQNTNRGSIHYNDATDRIEYSGREGTYKVGQRVLREGTESIPAGSTLDVALDDMAESPLNVAYNLISGSGRVSYEIARSNNNTHVKFLELSDTEVEISYIISQM